MHAQAFHIVSILRHRKSDLLFLTVAHNSHTGTDFAPHVIENARCISCAPVTIDRNNTVADFQALRPFVLDTRHQQFALAQCRAEGQREYRRRRILPLFKKIENGTDQLDRHGKIEPVGFGHAGRIDADHITGFFIDQWTTGITGIEGGIGLKLLDITKRFCTADDAAGCRIIKTPGVTESDHRQAGCGLLSTEQIGGHRAGRNFGRVDFNDSQIQMVVDIDLLRCSVGLIFEAYTQMRWRAAGDMGIGQDPATFLVDQEP